MIFYTIHTADYETVFILEQLILTLSLSDDRVLMAGVCSGELAGAEFKYAKPYSDEHLLTVMVADLSVYPLQYLCRTHNAGQSRGLYEDL